MSTNMHHHKSSLGWPLPEEHGEWVWVPKQNATSIPCFTASLHESQSVVMHPFAETPVEPFLEEFDINMALQLHAYLEDTSAPADPLSPQAAPSLNLFDNTFVDESWFSGLDFSFTAEANSQCTSPSVVSPDFSGFASQCWSEASTSPGPNPQTPYSPSPAAASPDLITSPPAAAAVELLACSQPSCPKTFEKQSDLRKHERKHRKLLGCPVCGKAHHDRRALARHLWAQHAEYAQKHKTPLERVKCPLCDYEGRQDNVLRHKKTTHDKPRPKGC